MKKYIAAALLWVFAVSVAAAPLSGVFTRANSKTASVSPQGKNGCRVDLKGGSATAVLPVKYTAHSQYILLFVLRGGSAATSAEVTPEIVVKQARGIKTYRAKAVPVRGTAVQTVKIEYGNAFGLGDAFYAVQKLRFIVSGKKGSKVYISGIRSGDKDELSGTGVGVQVFTAWKAPAPRTVPGLAPVKVYFELDNNDLDQHIRRWRAQEMAPDPNFSGGFRQLLLDNADGIVELAKTPEEADVLVISCARKRNLSKLVKLAKAGKKVLLYGPVSNRELDEIAPLTMQKIKISGLAGRKTISKAQEHPGFGNAPLTDADFGIYYNTRLAKGEPLIKYADGNIAAARSGNVIQFVPGLGVHIQKPGKVYFDDTFLRMAVSDSPAALKALAQREKDILLERENSRRTLVESMRGKKSDNSQWHIGMHKDNVGRFGWLTSEGLLVGDIGRDFGVNNAEQHYRFAPVDDSRISLPEWKHKVISGNVKFKKSTPSNTDPTEHWGGLGTVEYTSTFTVPGHWKGSEIAFMVDNGIDDIDETSVNGVVVGKTDKNHPEYWICSRKYVIPAKVLKPGVNTLSVRVTNLRDQSRMNSRPYIAKTASSAKKKARLTVLSADWVGKRYLIEDGLGSRELYISLLTPFTLNKLNTSSAALNIEAKSAQFAAVPLKGGVKIIDLRKNATLYSLRRDGKLSEPWILLFRENWSKARPIMLAFEKNPELLAVKRSGAFVSALNMSNSGGIGHVACGWPWGVKPQDASKWTEKLPAGVLKHVRSMVPLALNYPVALDEIYSVDKSKVHIINRFRYLDVSGNWSIKNKKYAFIPPMAGFMLKRKDYVSTADKLGDFNCNTDYGPLMGKSGCDTVSYSLELPQDNDLVPVDVKADAKLHKSIDSFVENGLRWSRGGRVPCSEFSFAWPEGERKHPESITLSFYTWNYGFSTSYQGYFMLSDRVKTLLADRLRRRYNMPLEFYIYKSALVHRLEPFSGLKYPILFDHNHENSTNYAPGIGSRVIFGDANEGCTMLAWIGDVQANIFGETGVVRGAWNFIRYGMRYETVIDDYAFHASTCREFGGGSFIDMLNGEYAAFVSFARLARVNGDSETEKEALYRAAKRGIPTLARLFYLDYIAENMPHIDLTGAVVCTGFSEDRQNVLRLPSSSHNFVNGNEIFDLAQGFPGTLHRLYERHALAEVKKYVNNSALPYFAERDIMAASYFTPMFIYAEKGFPTDMLFERVLKRSKRMKNDWPGMRMSYLMGMKLWRQYGRVALSEFENIAVKKASLDPATSTLEIEVEAFPGARLAITSDPAVKSVTRNGKAVKTQTVKRNTVIPLVQGRNSITVKLGKIVSPVQYKKVKSVKKRSSSADKPGKLIWREEFKGDVSKRYKCKSVSVVDTPEGKALKVTDALGNCVISVPENETVRFSAKMKIENVVRFNSKQHWTGSRFAMYGGKAGRAGVRAATGSFDWKEVSFKKDIPAGTSKITLQLGLKDATGVVYFRDIKAEVIK